MSGQQVTVNSRKYDLSIRKTWSCELVRQDGPLIVLVGEFDRDVAHPKLGFLQRGTISYEYYWLDRWYNIFQFHEPGGGFRNYYCNIAMPPTFENSVLEYVDLDIDVLIQSNFEYEILDRDDFERNTVKFGYPKDVIKAAEASLLELLALIENGQLP